MHVYTVHTCIHTHIPTRSTPKCPHRAVSLLKIRNIKALNNQSTGATLLFTTAQSHTCKTNDNAELFFWKQFCLVVSSIYV